MSRTLMPRSALRISALIALLVIGPTPFVAAQQPAPPAQQTKGMAPAATSPATAAAHDPTDKEVKFDLRSDVKKKAPLKDGKNVVLTSPEGLQFTADVKNAKIKQWLITDGSKPVRLHPLDAAKRTSVPECFRCYRISGTWLCVEKLCPSP